MDPEVSYGTGDGHDRALARARRRVKMRAGLCGLVVVVAVWAIHGYRERLAYFFGGGELVDVGDVRALRASGVETLPASPGSYVRLRNLIVSRDSARTRTYRFFYCPIYRVVVRTARPLPEGSIRITPTEILPGLEFLVQQRKVFVEDFALHFDAEGWLLPLRQFFRWQAGLEDYARTELELSDKEIDASFALLDGETPGGQYWAVIVLVSSILMVLASFAGLMVAARALRRLQAGEALDSGRTAVV